jgi:uncharacterized protein
VVIAIFPSLEGESLEDVSIRLAERWRIGRKGLDDGVILVVFVQDRKVRLEVGYGLEGRLPDADADRIIREEIAPSFRQGHYAEGLQKATAAVYARIEGRKAGAEKSRRSSSPSLPVLGFFGLMGLLVALFAWEAMSTRRQGMRQHYSLGRGGWYVPTGSSWRSSGGSWSGGFGGGGSGGGFSGGGGSFGGGGASGSW